MKKALLNIKISTEDEKKLVELEKHIQSISDKQKKLKGDNKEATKTYQENAIAVKKLKTEQNELVKSINSKNAAQKADLRTIGGINAALSEEKRRIKELVIGSAEFKKSAAYIKDLENKQRNFNKELGRGNTIASQTQKGFMNAFKAIGGAIVGVIAVFRTYQAVISKNLELYDKQAKALAQVEQGIKSTGGTSGKTLEYLSKTAKKLQSETLFGDESILQGVSAQILTFTNITGKNFDRVQKAVLDVSSRIYGANANAETLRATSIQLGKALNDPVANLGALSRSGIQFSKEQKEVIKHLADTNRLAEAQTIILDELEKQYGGSAAAAARAGMGPLTQLKNIYNDIREVIGKMIMETINNYIPVIKRGIEILQGWISVPLSKSLQETRFQMSAELEVLKSGNLTAEQRKNLINKINIEYGEYLPYLITEESTIKEITTAQNAANTTLLDKIKLIAKEEVLQKERNKVTRLQRYLFEQQIELEKQEIKLSEETNKRKRFFLEDSIKTLKMGMENTVEMLGKEETALLKSETALNSYITATEIITEAKKELGAGIITVTDSYTDLSTAVANYVKLITSIPEKKPDKPLFKTLTEEEKKEHISVMEFNLKIYALENKGKYELDKKLFEKQKEITDKKFAYGITSQKEHYLELLELEEKEDERKEKKEKKKREKEQKDKEFWRQLDLDIEKDFKEVSLKEIKESEKAINDVIKQASNERIQQTLKEKAEFEKAQQEKKIRILQLSEDFGEIIGNAFADTNASFEDFLRNSLILFVKYLEKRALLAITEATLKEVGSKGFIGIGTAALATIAIKAASSGLQGIIKGFAGSGRVDFGLPISRMNGDNRLITAKTGEVYLNKQHQQMLGGASTFKAIGVPGFAQGGQVGITSNASPLFDIDEFVNKLAEKINDKNVNLNINEVISSLQEREKINIIKNA